MFFIGVIVNLSSFVIIIFKICCASDSFSQSFPYCHFYTNFTYFYHYFPLDQVQNNKAGVIMTGDFLVTL